MTKPGNVSVDAVLAAWRQGDSVVGDHWFVHRVAPEHPLTAEATAAAKEDVDVAEVQVSGLVVVSQTCDVVRPSAERPYVEVAPLVAVDAGELRGIERGRRPRYAFVPGLRDEHLVADLDRIMTVEKAVVAAWTRLVGCSSDEEAHDFAQALGRKRMRFAFPDDFTEFAGELQDRLQEKHEKRSDEGEALRQLREIRVRAAPGWYADRVDIMFWFIRNDDERALRQWLDLVPEGGRFHPVHGAVVALEDMTARDYVESDPLDLDHLSTRPA